MAPEVLACKPYSEKCDIWSCGVLMYLMLSGYPPFYGHTREDIINAAMMGKVEFTHPNWKKVSEEGKKLILQLLTYNDLKRISAAAALKHPWIQKYAMQENVKPEDLRMAFANMRNFRIQLLFQQAVLSYLASQQMHYEEENKIRKMFSFLDTDKDGQLSKQDLTNGAARIYKDHNKAKREADLIMKNMNIDGNRFIDYNGIIFD